MAEQHVVEVPLRERAERQIALAKATGSKAYPSADYRVVFVERRDGTRETVRIETAPH
ncbi:hypothetical protein [Terricaulis silvestris]|uniref:Uncharacterized protein n=1 Tax=Terricaulis silvestris TaxID=2686094 RepID=A0A6I6MNA3_9CAUL|nr:hypothetical protein [Terricaulis silvestris]QGZ95551.1 hypothetical protein DSM104635_02401 [Terricaulis silvestris]